MLDEAEFLTNVQLVTLIVDGLDDEAKCWADSVHIFIHDLLDNGRLACIVEASAWASVSGCA